MSSWRPIIAAACLAGTVSLAQGEDEFRVWVVPGVQRVLRSDTPGAMTAARISAARNEWESFQLALRSAKPVRIVGLEMASLSHPAVAMAPMPMPETWRFYREHQLHITKGTYRNTAFKPDWYPDALIPVMEGPGAASADKARFLALPFDLPADETHAFWVDVHVPDTMGAGEHRRWVWLRTEDGGFRSIPVTLTVHDFVLPTLATLHTQFGSPADRLLGWYRGEVGAKREKTMPDAAALYDQAAQLLTEHRFNCPLPPRLLTYKVKTGGAFDLTPEQIQGISDFAARYHVNAVPVPRPQSWWGDPVKEHDFIVNWAKSWDRNLTAAGLGDRLCYTYLLDEPNDAKAYDEVRRWAKPLRQSGSRVKVLVTEQTWTQDPAWGTLEGAVDIWVPLFSLFKAESAARRQAQGEAIWTYTALCQGKEPTPWWHTDFPLAHYRVPAWIAWRYGMKGLLYWGGMVYWKEAADPWTDPWTYGKPKSASAPFRVYNGEGTLLYPGRDCGVVGAVPSVRLKTLRDAIEDFEYLAMCDRLGKRAEALKIVTSVARSWTDWSNDPAAIDAARSALAALITAAPRPGG